MKYLLIMLCCMALSTAAFAFTVDVPLTDATQEARAGALFQQVKCVVCAGQSLTSSNVEVAQAMRATIRQQIAAGQTDDAILQFLIQRYGEQVLLAPPLSPHTLVLWAAPFALLLAGGLWIMLRAKKRVS